MNAHIERRKTANLLYANFGASPMVQRVKYVAIAVLALLVLIIVLQNTESVDTQLLFITISMPRAALLFGTLVVGFLLGMLLGHRLLRQRK